MSILTTAKVHPDIAFYDKLADHQQVQIDHLLGLLDAEFGLPDAFQRREVSLIGARILGIELPGGAELARCQGQDGDCPVLTANTALSETTHGYRCEDCLPAFHGEYGE
ncbi:hypothetical protein ABTX81_30340 [Kitasatospora sp. NPDC097605]|uniref:hypothetical protein n=1 Tax=Kitasatospora sp. NPDC097605 TaxID=3157226 RepID=UPI003329F1A0